MQVGWAHLENVAIYHCQKLHDIQMFKAKQTKKVFSTSKLLYFETYVFKTFEFETRIFWNIFNKALFTWHKTENNIFIDKFK